MEPLRTTGLLIFVIGCPGAGKGTLCHKLAAHCNWAHVSVGDEIRKYCRMHGEKEDGIWQCVQSSELIPVEHLAVIVGNHIQALQNEGHTSFIVDGFPRCANQIEYMQNKIGVPDWVVFMDCPKTVAKERVLMRKIAERLDTEEVFEKRFAEFQANNRDILDHYDAANKLIKVDTKFAPKVSFQHLLEKLEQEGVLTPQAN